MSGAVKPKAFAPSNGPPERDPVAVYKIHSEKRPDAMKKLSAVFIVFFTRSWSIKLRIEISLAFLRKNIVYKLFNFSNNFFG